MPHSRPGLQRRQLLCTAPALLLGGLAHAQAAFPFKPITLTLPMPAGGATDVQARALAQSASEYLKQQVIVLNRPGNGGTLGPAIMARSAAPDGYNISITPATLFRLPHLMKTTFDPLTDFSYILNLTGYTNGIVVRHDAPWKTLQELLADARQRPEQISFGATGQGSGGHIAMERLAKAAGVRLNFIPYKGMAEETTALLGGHLDVISDPGWGPMVESGRARVLATLSAQRLARWPQIPTLKELGYDLVVDSPLGLAGPRGMEPAVVQKLHDAFHYAMQQAPYLEALAHNDQIPLYMDSPTYTRYAIEQTAREKVFVSALNIGL